MGQKNAKIKASIIPYEEAIGVETAAIDETTTSRSLIKNHMHKHATLSQNRTMLPTYNNPPLS